MNNTIDLVKVIPSLVALSTSVANLILSSANKIYRHKLKTNRPIKSKGIGLSLLFFDMNPILIKQRFSVKQKLA